jgi:hypothetical protein
MRTVIIKDRSDLQSVGVKLLGEQAGTKRALDRLVALNPHVDFNRIEAGTVLFVPDAPGVRDTSGSVEGQAFGDLRDQLLASVDAASVRVRSGHEALSSQRQEITAVVKLAAVKRAIESDPELKAQVDAATQVFKQDQAQAKAADEALKAMKEQATAALAEIAKMLA